MGGSAPLPQHGMGSLRNMLDMNAGHGAILALLAIGFNPVAELFVLISRQIALGFAHA